MTPSFSPCAAARLAAGLAVAAGLAALPPRALAVDLSSPPRLAATGQGVLEPALAEVATVPKSMPSLVDAGFRVRDGRVQVLVETTSPEAVAVWLGDRGAAHVLRSARSVQAWVGPALLGELGERPEVARVRRPDYVVVPDPVGEPLAVKAGNVTSEGVAASHADGWHAVGITGAGVKVGVVDAGFESYVSLLGTELPTTDRVTFRAFGGSQNSGSGDHGTACAEIVHDMAPGAELYLALVSTNVDIENAIDWLQANGVTVATMSLGFTTLSPHDGTGSLNDEIAASVAGGDIAWATSAGNSRQGHWQGRTTDSDGDGWVELAPGEELNAFAGTLRSGDRVRSSVVWNDWDRPANDYALYLYRIAADGSTSEVARADGGQTGGAFQRPIEQLSYTVAEDGRYGVAVFRKSVSGEHDLELFDTDWDFELVVEEGSLTIPADSPDLLAVAALATSSMRYRDYSSAGPTNGPGGALSGGFRKPDVGGYDGVVTVTGGRFYGTSAASPHVGGALALVREAQPTWTAAEVRAFLEDRAIDRGAVGPDTDYGAGRLSLGPAPGSNCSFAVSPTSASVGAGRSGGTVTVTTTAGCLWTAEPQVSWIGVVPDARTTSGIVAFTVEANPASQPRQGSALIAGHVFVVSQAGTPCAVALDPASARFPAAGGDGELAVDTDAGCAWTAAASVTWVEILAGATGSGPGRVLYRVAANPTPSERSGRIVVGDDALTVVQDGVDAGTRAVVGGIAEAPGAAGTRWRTDLAVLNPSGAATPLTVTYRHSGGQVERTASLAGAGLLSWPRAPVELFGVEGSSSGSVEVTSDNPVIVTARTYNTAPDGTYGQFLPGVGATSGLGDGATAVLGPLASNDLFRTNVGFVDVGGGGGRGEVTLHSAAGAPLGAAVEIPVGPLGWAQQNRVFEAAGAGSCDACYAVVRAVGAGERLWAYASVVDNASGDPTTLPGAAGAADAGPWLVAGIADTAGLNDTRWKSTLAIVNRSAGEASATLLYRHAGGVDEHSVAIPGNGMAAWDNVAVDLFGRPSSSGAVEVVSSSPLSVTARTYNDGPDGTFGQSLPGVTAADALGSGGRALLSQLASSDSFRTNIGFANLGDAPCEASIQLYDAGGAKIGSPLDLTVPAGGWAQQNRVFQVAGVAECASCYAAVEVLTPGGQVWAYASVVDNGSGDPTTVPMVVVP